MRKLLILILVFVCFASMNAEDVTISNAQDLMNFAQRVNNGEGDLNAVLSADIDMDGIADWTPIGQDRKDYKGHFDGQGHRILNLKVENTGNNNQALFGQAIYPAIIENVIIDATCTIKGAAYTAGILGHVWGDDVIVRNCGNEGTIVGSGGNAAGIIGCSEKIVHIDNCYNTGSITGNHESAAICAWMGSNSSTIKNCFNLGSVTGQDGDKRMYRKNEVTGQNLYDIDGQQATQITEEQVRSGELAYLLNGQKTADVVWHQKLGAEADSHPYPFGTDVVYANGELKCDGSSVEGGTLTYSNSSTSDIPPHTNENGWCTVCGALDNEYLIPDGDGYYSIGTAYNLHWFAELVKIYNESAKAKLTADIDYRDYKQGFIGSSQSTPFRGTFDGREHTIIIDIVNNGTARTGLFAYINAATIKNLVVEGSATSAGPNCVGGLGGRSDGNGTLIENVIVKATVSYTGNNTDATCGGFFANMESQVTLKNCAFYGSINTGTAEGNGGLVGWAGSGSNNKYINCLVAPVVYTKNGNSAEFARNNPLTTNCKFTSTNDTKIASGELCYSLNNGGDNWYQNLTGEVDSYPVPFSSHSKVYANASYNCDGTPKGNIVYENVNGESHDPHVKENGFCTVCNSMIEYVENYMTPAGDGYYEISDNKQMRWFAAMIKDYRNAHSITENAEANAPVNARLMSDIDFTGVKDYAPIGGLWSQGNTRYAGTFDGQGHKIKNLVINLDKNEVGIFGVIADGAVIKNFTLDSSCSINGGARVGIVGEVWRAKAGAEVHLECLGNEADITGTGNNVGGILGVNMINGGSYAKLYMTNCYSTGKIKGNSENGQLTGWSGNNAVVKNCYATGEMENCDGFARLGTDSQVKNCYCDTELTWNDHPTCVTEEQIENGELCAKLGYGFRQNLSGEVDAYPNFNVDHGFVNQISAAGYSTQYNAMSDVTIPDDVEAFAGVKNGSWVRLVPIEDKIKAGVPVVLKASKGCYNFMPTTGAEEITNNDLQGSDGSVAFGGNIYVLANKTQGIGFYKTGGSGKVPEGRAYLDNSGSSVKEAYLFSFDDEETAIANVNVNGNGNNAAIYNMVGQRISKLQKGINIVNGKKVLF